MTSVNWLVFVVVVGVVATVDAVEKRSTPCKTKSDGLLPYHRKCSLFYNCSTGLLDECLHPQLFNPDTQQCEHYTMVTCGTRKEPLNYCDYSRQFCSRCQPCTIPNPSCTGLSDGMHYWPGRKESPYFIVCVKERNVYQGQCPPDLLFDEKKICYRPWCTV